MKKKLFLFLCSLMPFFSFGQHTESMYLSGTGSDDTVLWDFYCTAGNRSGQWTKIPVPSNWEFHGFGQFTYGHDKERLNESGIYRYQFIIPENWRNKKIHIVFEGSMTDTEVRINGQSAGEKHQGAFYCFKYDITKTLKFGKTNDLEVTVHKSSSNYSVEDAERIADFWVFGGIFRPVWLEALPLAHIERVAIDARSDGKFNMDVFMGGRVKKGEVTAQVKTLDGTPVGTPVRQPVFQQDSIRLSSFYVNPALWSSEFPNRYQVEVELYVNGERKHVVMEKFGFRTVELRPGDGFYVNGTKIKFKGVNRHTHWPTTGRASNRSISLQDALLIKEMNMNAVRMSHYPPDEHFLEICDSLGLYVIDELTGWQSAYDTPAGRKLVREMVTRDVNHPCVVMWSNGNEGGFNFDLLPDYARYDIQKRQVIHPWLEEEVVNTFHYIPYGVGSHFFFEGNKVFFPTEFLHGLYDGGHGAGLDDYWKLMQDNPLSAGGFLWDFADQGVVRNDKRNIMDTDGNHAADGILGPYREKEGSFYTIKEVWSPIYLEGTTFLPLSFDGFIRVQNRYHFTNLKQCSFIAKWIKFDFPTGISAVSETKVIAPDIAPGISGALKIALPQDIHEYDALYLTAIDPFGKEIYTWTRRITPASVYAARLVDLGNGQVNKEADDDQIRLSSRNVRLIIDKRKGVIQEISVNGKRLPLSNGPRFTYENFELIDVQPIVKKDVEAVRFMYKPKDSDKQQTRNIIQIGLLPAGWIEIAYSFDVGGLYDNIGITFDFPEDRVKRVRWLGNGPYRVWKNRMKGVTFNLWEKAYNNTVTGESWVYPEFKGYHSNLYAADLVTDDGLLRLVAASEDLFLHLFTPDNPEQRNNDNTLGIFPNGQLSILNAISPVGTKFHKANQLGPQSQQNNFVSSSHAEPLKGTVYIKYIP
ncbi:glycoside hydrolase family 2 protein [Parabacteroides sp. Marseille-P3160]|uniref:glycoside hydrolase family 2 protein n=1 Tax=Parabacteroides sp. Marseille-P3160 TaxID=1917887 RepID=UPI0009BB94AE|nr:glycoside hydrolase family 2 TIM barrel-domain containing protein [Parabacteroides sp. Marseille-P3160]